MFHSLTQRLLPAYSYTMCHYLSLYINSPDISYNFLLSYHIDEILASLAILLKNRQYLIHQYNGCVSCFTAFHLNRQYYFRQSVLNAFHQIILMSIIISSYTVIGPGRPLMYMCLLITVMDHVTPIAINRPLALLTHFFSGGKGVD